MLSIDLSILLTIAFPRDPTRGKLSGKFSGPTTLKSRDVCMVEVKSLSSRIRVDTRLLENVLMLYHGAKNSFSSC